MNEHGYAEFEKEVDKAYKILKKMLNKEGECKIGSLDSMRESQLKAMINAIDDIMGR